MIKKVCLILFFNFFLVSELAYAVKAPTEEDTKKIEEIEKMIPKEVLQIVPSQLLVFERGKPIKAEFLGYDMKLRPLKKDRAYLRVAYNLNASNIGIPNDVLFESGKGTYDFLTINHSNVLGFNGAKSSDYLDTYRILLCENKFPFYRFDYLEIFNTINSLKAMIEDSPENKALNELKQKYEDFESNKSLPGNISFKTAKQQIKLQNSCIEYVESRLILNPKDPEVGRFLNTKKYCEEEYGDYPAEGEIKILGLLKEMKNFLNAGIESCDDKLVKDFFSEKRKLFNKEIQEEQGEIQSYLTSISSIDINAKTPLEIIDEIRILSKVPPASEAQEKQVAVTTTYTVKAMKWFLDKKEQIAIKQEIIDKLLHYSNSLSDLELKEMIGALKEFLNSNDISNLQGREGIDVIKKEIINFLNGEEKKLNDKETAFDEVKAAIQNGLKRKKYPLAEEQISNIVGDIENFLRRKSRHLIMQKNNAEKFSECISEVFSAVIQGDKEKVKEVFKKEKQYIKTEAQKTMDAIKKFLKEEKSTLNNIKQLFGEEILEESLREIENKYDPQDNIRLFLDRWGREAEDVLVFHVLKHIKKYGQIPNKIEIYGTLDPCFQCQIKLQWLADLLAGRLEGAKIYENMGQSFKGPVEICYYSKEKAETGCVLFNLPNHVVKTDRYMTRSIDERDKIKKFTFSSDRSAIKQEEQDIEIFNVFDVDLENPYHLTLKDIENIIIDTNLPIKIHLKNYESSMQQECKAYMKKIHTVTQAKNKDKKNKISIEVAVTKKEESNIKYGVNCDGSEVLDKLLDLCSGNSRKRQHSARGKAKSKRGRGSGQ